MRGSIAVLLLAGLPAAVWAQAPDFRINTYTTGSQFLADVAGQEDGSFVVVWRSEGQDGDAGGVFGRRFAPAGAPLGGEFQVNSYTTGAQTFPCVAALASGGFVVVWQSDGQDGGGRGVFAMRFDSAGTPDGPEFQVNTYTTGHQGSPDVGSDAAGGFVVVWDSGLNSPGTPKGIFGRRFDAAGGPLGPEFRLDASTLLPFTPSVGVNDDGSFEAVWGDALESPGFFHVVGRRFDAAGTALGAPFVVDTSTTPGNRFGAKLSPRGDGSFVVVWQADGQYLGAFTVDARRYDSAGNPLGGDFQIAGDAPYYPLPAVAQHADGGFQVVWWSAFDDGNFGSIVGQKLDPSGTAQGPRFVVNTTTAGFQYLPALAPAGAGGDVAVWHGPDDPAGGTFGVFGRVLGDTSVSLAIGPDIDVIEGDSGTTDAVFTVALTGTASQTVTVDYATVPITGWARPGIDYVHTAGTLTFAPGTTLRTISVPVIGDTLDEHNEPFGVGLGSVTNAVVTRVRALGTILDDDPLPSVSIADVVVDEGTSGTVNAVFTVSLTPVSGRYVDVDFATANGTATAPADYTEIAFDRLEIPPGSASGTITVSVNSDGVPEGPETFFVNLSNPFYATIADSQGQGTILDPPSTTTTKGDFNGDGRVDILFRHAVSGKNVVWYMDGITRTAGVFTNPDQLPDTNWQIAGTADFNGDQKTDLLWRHAVSGRNVVWYMSGITRTAGVFTNPNSLADTRWRMVGTGDFSSPPDGKPDILWRHTVSGKNVVWYMDGINRTAGVFTNPDTLADTRWQMAGVGDFWSLAGGQDAKPDILWRHTLSGKNVVWYMDGITRTAGVFTNPDTLPETNWQMVGVGDFSAPLDGKPDILFRHQLSGRNVVWYMNGPNRTGGVFTNPDVLPDTNWRIVGPR